MRLACTFIRRAHLHRLPIWPQRRSLLTLAIETSCDDTSVAVLEKHKDKSTLHFHSKITSDNRAFLGIHPLVALRSHQKTLASLVKVAIESLPVQRSEIAHLGNSLIVRGKDGVQPRKKPDFVTVTRGPGMNSSLNSGLDTAKGLAVAWQVPLLGVNHMQAHALTPRLVASLDVDDGLAQQGPSFPFLSFLVSGGHTMLVHSQGLCDHRILANTIDIAIGDLMDKCAREILPKTIIDEIENVMFGPLLEKFAFPRGTEDYFYTAPATKGQEFAIKETGYDWGFTPPFSRTGLKNNSMEFTFCGIGSKVEQVMGSNPNMIDAERRVLAHETMRVAFEHLASRLIIALRDPNLQDVKTLVVSGGVAANQYLKHVLRAVLDKKGFESMEVIFPPPSLCTDNAAMIAWTGMEMWEHGLETELSVTALRKWAIDPNASDGGILGVEGWMPRSKPYE